MEKIIFLNKKEGETPLEALEVFRIKNKSYKDVSMTYAGRLDPLASGLLLILAGEEVNQKQKYLALDKEYEFEILFGFTTDTYDILGVVNNSTILTNYRIDNLEKEIKENLKYFTGKFVQRYPMYSSKTVKGKPLFVYARDGIDVKVPQKEVNVKSLKFIKLRKITSKNLFKNIEKRILKVTGDFRQEEILKIWKKELTIRISPQGKALRSYYVASFKIKCESGTYVRSIANSLGKKINIPTLAYSIKRTKIGEYGIINT
ncbi:MAG: hypothetical protein AAB636_00330 [Patescibacteria group bacterium]